MTDPDGVDNVAACTDCHADFGVSFDEKTYLDVDHDGDGTVEGLQAEVHGLLDTLAAMLPSLPDTNAYDPDDDPDTTWTIFEMKAAFNYDFVYYDHSYGIHNPSFSVALLKLSIDILKDTALVAIDPGIDTGLPLEYALSQNYPNPFNPTTTIDFSLKATGHVKLIVYNTLGREVMQVVDGPMTMGKHSVVLDSRNLASGVYFYRISANEYTAIRKMLVMK